MILRLSSIKPGSSRWTSARDNLVLVGQPFYLLRPDGHVGLAGGRFDPVALYGYLWDCGVRLVLPRPNRAKFGRAALAVENR